MRLTFSLVAITAAISSYGCNNSKSSDAFDDRGILIEGSTNQGLLLTSVENYESSRLFFYDFATGKRSQIMSGESGDPGLFLSSNQIFFFNRTTGNSNLRTISTSETPIKVGVQNAIPGAGFGDPHDALHLDERFLLLSFWASNKLGIFDLQTSSLIKTVELPFDIGTAAANVFHPSSLFASVDGSENIYIVHQGANSDGITLNGSQQIFVVNWDGSELTAIDLDANKEKIQGIPLKVSNPTGVFPNTSGTSVTVFGACTIYNVSDCVGGFETVNLTERTSSLTYDMSDLPEKNNGAVIAIDDQTFYAQLIILGANADLSNSEKIVARIDTASKTTTRVYTYPAESNGCCGLFFEHSSKKLLLTEFTENDGGSLSVMDEAGSILEKIAVENTPYTGIIVPK